MLDNKIREYQIEKSLNDLKDKINELLSVNDKMEKDIKSIYKIIDNEANCYDASDNDIDTIKDKALENSRALDKIFEIVDKYI